jgi:hypothetical protein
MVRSILRVVREGGAEHADLCGQEGFHGAEDPGRDGGEYCTGVDGGRALWHQRADSVEVAKPGRFERPEPRAEQAAGDVDTTSGGRRCRALQDSAPAAR